MTANGAYSELLFHQFVNLNDIPFDLSAMKTKPAEFQMGESTFCNSQNYIRVNMEYIRFRVRVFIYLQFN
jgi:hypothetical protein